MEGQHVEQKTTVHTTCFPDRAGLLHLLKNRLVGLVVKASASKAEDPGFESRLRPDFFPGSSHTSELKKLSLQWLPCQARGFIGSALGLVGPVSVYCDWVR